MSTNIRKEDLLYPELSYKILGKAFKVWSELGFGHKEIVYQRAIANILKEEFKIQEQCPAKIIYNGKNVGIYYFDFLIEDKIVLELKVRNYFSVKDIKQLYSYLKSRKLKLGILIHFTSTGVKSKRVVNIS